MTQKVLSDYGKHKSSEEAKYANPNRVQDYGSKVKDRLEPDQHDTGVSIFIGVRDPVGEEIKDIETIFSKTLKSHRSHLAQRSLSNIEKEIRFLFDFEQSLRGKLITEHFLNKIVYKTYHEPENNEGYQHLPFYASLHEDKLLEALKVIPYRQFSDEIYIEQIWASNLPFDDFIDLIKRFKHLHNIKNGIDVSTLEAEQKRKTLQVVLDTMFPGSYDSFWKPKMDDIMCKLNLYGNIIDHDWVTVILGEFGFKLKIFEDKLSVSPTMQDTIRELSVIYRTQELRELYISIAKQHDPDSWQQVYDRGQQMLDNWEVNKHKLMHFEGFEGEGVSDGHGIWDQIDKDPESFCNKTYFSVNEDILTEREMYSEKEILRKQQNSILKDLKLENELKFSLYTIFKLYSEDDTHEEFEKYIRSTCCTYEVEWIMKAIELFKTGKTITFETISSEFPNDIGNEYFTKLLSLCSKYKKGMKYSTNGVFVETTKGLEGEPIEIVYRKSFNEIHNTRFKQKAINKTFLRANNIKDCLEYSSFKQEIYDYIHLNLDSKQVEVLNNIFDLIDSVRGKQMVHILNGFDTPKQQAGFILCMSKFDKFVNTCKKNENDTKSKENLTVPADSDTTTINNSTIQFISFEPKEANFWGQSDNSKDLQTQNKTDLKHKNSQSDSEEEKIVEHETDFPLSRKCKKELEEISATLEGSLSEAIHAYVQYEFGETQFQALVEILHGLKTGDTAHLEKALEKFDGMISVEQIYTIAQKCHELNN